MKTAIDVANRREGELIKQALTDPSVRAFATVVGVLQALPNDRARARVLSYFVDLLEEQVSEAEAVKTS